MIRKLLNDIHLWVGLLSGIFVFLICLSGSIYVFDTEIRELTQPELYRVNSIRASKKLPAETLIASTIKQAGGKVISIKIPSDPNKNYILIMRMDEESKPGQLSAAGSTSKDQHFPKDAANKLHGKTGGSERAKGTSNESQAAVLSQGRVEYMVNPYTGKIAGNNKEKTPIAVFMSYMFSLHRWLLLDRIEEPIIGELPNRKLGSYISGTATILFTLGVITGIIIWFPRKIRNWRQGLVIKRDANWKRVNHDLHNSFGFYSCIFLFMMGITGPQWSFPWYKDGLRKSLGTYQPEGAKKQTPKSNVSSVASYNKIYLEDYIKAAEKELDYAGDYTITLPADSSDAISVSKKHAGFFAPAAPDKLLLDQYSASVLQRDIFRDKPLNEWISASIKAIHVGEVYGGFTKILYFLVSLVATTLPITGTLIWINKLKKGN